MLFGMVLFLGTACGRKDPQACFQVSETLVDQNEEVTFSNCSIYQEAGYAWDMGDGTTSDATGLVHRFQSQGEYTVVLTSKGNRSSKDDIYSEVITVGKRFLTRIEILTVPDTDSQGNDWDAGDLADVAFLVIRDSIVELQTIANDNLTIAPPFNFTFNNLNLELTPAVWTFAMVDIDGTVMDTMATYTLDLNTFIPNSFQTVPFDSSGSKWALHYNVN